MRLALDPPLPLPAALSSAHHTRPVALICALLPLTRGHFHDSQIFFFFLFPNLSAKRSRLCLSFSEQRGIQNYFAPTHYYVVPTRYYLVATVWLIRYLNRCLLLITTPRLTASDFGM